MVYMLYIYKFEHHYLKLTEPNYCKSMLNRGMNIRMTIGELSGHLSVTLNNLVISNFTVVNWKFKSAVCF